MLRVGDTFRSQITTETDPFVEFEFNRRVHRLESFVLAEKLAEDEYKDHVELMLPSSVWQHFKANHAASWWLGWLVRRRTVQYTTIRHELVVKVKRYASYPEANVPIERLGRPIPWEMVELDRTKTENGRE